MNPKNILIGLLVVALISNGLFTISIYMEKQEYQNEVLEDNEKLNQISDMKDRISEIEYENDELEHENSNLERENEILEERNQELERVLVSSVASSNTSEGKFAERIQLIECSKSDENETQVLTAEWNTDTLQHKNDTLRIYTFNNPDIQTSKNEEFANQCSKISYNIYGW